MAVSFIKIRWSKEKRLGVAPVIYPLRNEHGSETTGETEMNETLIARLRSYLEPDATIVRTGFVPIRQETILEILEALAEHEEAITRAHQHGYRQGIEAGARVAREKYGHQSVNSDSRYSGEAIARDIEALLTQEGEER